MKKCLLLTIVLLIGVMLQMPAQQALHEVITSDNAKLLPRYIGEKAEQTPVNGKNGFIPLHVAIQKNAVQCVRWLILSGANIELKTRNGSTPLSLAAWYGAGEIVAELIQAGANLGEKSPNGYQPLDWAFENQHYHVVEKLLFAWGLTSASQQAEKTLIQDLHKGHYPQIAYQVHFTSFPLLISIAKNDTTLLQRLLELGWQPNQQNAAGYAPLPFAARLGNTLMLSRLLRAGADPNLGGTKEHDVAGALNQAIRGLHSECAQLLLMHGALANKGNAKGITPLMLAAYYDRRDGGITKLLLNNNAEIRQQSLSGDDALDIALESRNRLFLGICIKHLFSIVVP